MSAPPRPSRRASGRRRRLLCLLTLALTLGLTSCDAALLNQVVANYADNATATTMNGGDNGWSIDLGNGRSMVLINDPYLGPIDQNGNRPPGSIITQGFGILVIDGDGSIDTLLRTQNGHKVSLFSPPESNRKYWVTGGFIDNNAVHLLVQELIGESDLLGNTVISLSLAHLRAATPSVQLAAPIVDIPQSNKAAWGEAVVSWDGHWYLYGPSRSGALRTLLARVPHGQLRDPAQWRYWTGSAWSAYQDNAAPLLKADGTALDRFIRPVVHDGRIVALTQDRGQFTTEFRWASSATPTSRYTVGQRAYRPPELDVVCAAGGKKQFVYALHPHTTTPADASIWSYSTNCSGSTSNSRYYRPKFFSLDLRNAPCPVLTADEADAFVRATHADLLDRPPTSNELATLGQQLTVDGRCRASYLQAMDDNAAYLGPIVDGLYQQLLGRDPDTGGRNYWIGELRSGARTTARMARAIIDDAEFWTKAQANNTGFVQRVYGTVLDRAPSSDDLAYWVGRLNAGDDRDVVGLAIYQSAESRGIRADGLADDLLHRAPTTGERTSWATAMAGNGGDDIAVTRSIVASATYLQIAQQRF